MTWYEQAAEKLKNEENGVTGRHESVMKGAVKDALLSFCYQDEEFAQAVVQGGSFGACMNAVAKGVGSCISDLDAYKKAVQFYFPGAKICMALTIDLIGDARHGDEPRGILLDLADFF